MVFCQDGNRVRFGFGPENFATLQHIALNLLKREKSLKRSLRGKRFAAALDQVYLLKVIQAGLSEIFNCVGPVRGTLQMQLALICLPRRFRAIHAAQVERFCEMATHKMLGFHLAHGGCLMFANIFGIGATRMKETA